MKQYIEVIGSSQFVERVSEYIADVNLSVRATKSETALNEAIELRNRCIETLLNSGLERSQLSEGGTEMWRSWFSRKQTGQEAFQKIIITGDDIARLIQSLAAIESLFDNQRYKLTIEMRQPKFTATPADREIARSAAIADAASHIDLLARAASLQVLQAVQIQEISAVKESSGMYGDERWDYYSLAAAGGSATGGDSYANLDPTTRKVTLRYRVRYAVEKI